MNHRFHFTVDGLFAYPLDNAENDFRAVERGNGKKIEHGEIHADKRRDIQKTQPAARCLLRRYADRGDRAAHAL